jgi:heptosyltransferase-2
VIYIIYQTSFIGDIILSTSMIRTVREVDPKGEIVFIGTHRGEEILAHNRDITHFVVYDKRGADRGFKGIRGIVAHVKEIVRDGESAFFSPHRFLRASLIGFLIGSENRISFRESAASFLYTTKVPYRYGIHEIERNHDLLAAYFGRDVLERPPAMPKLFPSRVDFEKAKHFALSHFHDVKSVVSIAPGSVWLTKRWPVEHFRELIRLLNENLIGVILIGGDEDRELCLELTTEKTVSLAGKLSILESAAAISFTDALITNDSAPLHIASAMNVPTIAIFGATTPHLGFGPLAERSVIVENRRVKCRPCGRHGGRKCRYKHHECMQSITPDAVFSRMMRILYDD